MRSIKRAREPPPALSCFAHSCNLANFHYTGQAIDPSRLHTFFSTMDPFDFKTVQHLDITTEDSPSMDVRDGQIVLTAKRGDASIVITAPLNGLVPQVAKTTVRNARRRRSVSHVIRGPRPTMQGSNNALSKLNEEQVLEIRSIANDASIQKEYKTKTGLYQAIASMYKVHPLTIKNIIDRVSWKHI